MLASIGATNIDALFDEIPAALKSGKLTAIGDGLNEMQVTRLMQERAALEDQPLLNFIGAGAYEHHIPAAVWQIATRGEFYTAYTPYQAEASQGTLQVLYEYQTMMASLTGMDVSNASLYDGASGLAEAILMAVRAHKTSRRVLLPADRHRRSTAAWCTASSSCRTSNWSRFRSTCRQRHHRSESAAATRGQRHCRAGHSAAEFLRRAGRRGRADRLGACAGCAGHRAGESADAGPAESAGAMGKSPPQPSPGRERERT